MEHIGRALRPGKKQSSNISKTALAAFHEVAGILFTRQRYEEAYFERNRSVAAFEDAVKVATERYRAGHALYFEVLDVQQQLYPQENALAQTQLDHS